ncbi:hypothetical protein [Candidatus Laterigemmans baculatus]|uniref:hypothetical protein n=1 Tax=Candidatus Laterigemmans baculatus TaxID=2770505 RepID=UPI0013DB951C|nr:hypothetical protein [Candidatus Laterigemmans baculatus]
MKRTILVGVMVLGTSICSQSFGFDLLDRMLGLKGSGCDSTCCDTAVGGHGLFGGHGGCLEPACGLEAPCGGCNECLEPACGLEAPCGGCLEPACGLEAPCGDCFEPACGLEAPCGGCDAGHCGGKKHHLLGKLFGKLKRGHHGCDSCEPACGLEASACGCGSCEPACGLEVVSDCGGCDTASCCGKGHGGLLKKLFGHLRHKNSDCCEIGCEAGPACTSCMSTPVGVPTQAPAIEADPAQEVSPMPPAPVVDPSAYLHSKRRVIQASTHYTR